MLLIISNFVTATNKETALQGCNGLAVVVAFIRKNKGLMPLFLTIKNLRKMPNAQKPMSQITLFLTKIILLCQV